MGIVTFGEIMLRLTPSVQGTKIQSAGAFAVGFAGAESNVASTLGVLKNKVSFVSKLPVNQLGDAAEAALGAYGVATNLLLRGEGRMGTYFIETGTSIRPSKVIYDRANSAIAEIKGGELEWDRILAGAEWFFLSGITPALSEQCRLEAILAVQTARSLGVKVGFDMNYRRTLWGSAAEAQKVFDSILEHTDLLFANTGVLQDVYSMESPEKNAGDRTLDMLSQAAGKFGLNQLAFTIRAHTSASENDVSGASLLNGNQVVARNYTVQITDRLGTGDAFAGAYLHGLLKGWNQKKVIDFATAAFALKHTILGDQHTSSEDEITSTMEGDLAGHILR